MPHHSRKNCESPFLSSGGITSSGGWTRRTSLNQLPFPFLLQLSPSGQTRPVQVGGGGSLLPRSLRLGMLDTRGEAPAHQHPGMSRSPQKLACLTTAKPILHPNPLGQHGRCIPHQQAGLQQKQVPDQSTALPSPTLRESPLALNGASHSGTPELLGRLPLQGSPHQSGMGTQPTVLQTTSQPLSSPYRPLCPTGQRKTPSLRVPLQSPGGDSNRLPLLELEPLGSNLPLPTPFSAPSLPSQAGNLLRRRHPDCSSLTRRSMVASVKKRFESLDLNLDIFQTIQGRTLWAHEVTSLRFRAFNFLPKSTTPPSLQMSPLPLRRPIALPLPRSMSNLGKISNSGFRNTLTLPSPRNSPSSTSTT